MAQDHSLYVITVIISVLMISDADTYVRGLFTKTGKKATNNLHTLKDQENYVQSSLFQNTDFPSSNSKHDVKPHKKTYYAVIRINKNQNIKRPIFVYFKPNSLETTNWKQSLFETTLYFKNSPKSHHKHMKLTISEPHVDLTLNPEIDSANTFGRGALSIGGIQFGPGRFRIHQ